MEWFWFILVTLVAYLIGSVNTAIFAGRFLAGDDIRSHGSGNAGATNALRTYGKKAAFFVVLGDCFKAVVAILLGLLIANLTSLDSSFAVYGAGIGVALGHNFPLYFHFRGGKGVLVSTVTMFFADWRIALAVVILALTIMIITKYVSLGSILGAVLFMVFGALLHWGEWIYLLFSFLLAGLLIAMHHVNIKRLLAGTENKVGQKKK